MSKLIVFEGRDKTGKTTQAKRLFESNPMGLRLCKEPYVSPSNKIIINTLQNIETSARFEATLYTILRLSHLQATVLRKQAKDITYIFDRYFPSTIVYQCFTAAVLGEDPIEEEKLNNIRSNLADTVRGMNLPSVVSKAVKADFKRRCFYIGSLFKAPPSPAIEELFVDAVCDAQWLLGRKKDTRRARFLLRVVDGILKIEKLLKTDPIFIIMCNQKTNKLNPLDKYEGKSAEYQACVEMGYALVTPIISAAGYAQIIIDGMAQEESIVTQEILNQLANS